MTSALSAFVAVAADEPFARVPALPVGLATKWMRLQLGAAGLMSGDA